MNNRHWILLLVAAFLDACATRSVGPNPELRPADIVDVRSVDPGILVDNAYLGSENFLGRPVAGYRANKCYLVRPAAEALSRVAKALRAKDLFLKTRDCYRPQKAVDDFVRWAEDPTDLKRQRDYYPSFARKTDLFPDYIAKKSGHSRASTVDVILVAATDFGWQEIDMGTRYDFLDPSANTDSPVVGPEVALHRKILVDAMGKEDFVNLPEEWWHYTRKPEVYPKTFFNFDVE